MWALAGDIRAVLWLAVIPGMAAVWLIVRYLSDVPSPTGSRAISTQPPVLRPPALRRLPAPSGRLIATAVVLPSPPIRAAFLNPRDVYLGDSNPAPPGVLV